MIEFVDDNQVLNSTAGTSVVVPKPAGLVDGQLMVAFISAASVTTFTPPAGWEGIEVQDIGSSLRLISYWKVASTEGASWTWSLGASARNWGWVGCYSGVDTSDPIVVSDAGDGGSGPLVAAEFGFPQRLLHSMRVRAVSAYRTASGSATTWNVGSANERLDHSTNAGSGTDITGAVSDLIETTPIREATMSATASQSQTGSALMALWLRPSFTALTTPIDASVWLALGEDPDAVTFTDPEDITQYVRQAGGGIDLRVGKTSEGSQTITATLRLLLDNRDGRFTPLNPSGAYYPHIRRNTPIRVAVTLDSNTDPVNLFAGFVVDWSTGWSTGAHDSTVQILATGTFGRLDAIGDARSPLRASYEITSPVSQWPMEDASDATNIASTDAATGPGTILGTVSLAASSAITGSKPLPTFTAGGLVILPVRSHTAGTGWCVEVSFYIPSAPAGGFTLLEFRTGGTARRWTLTAGTPGGSTTTVIPAAYDAGGTELLGSAGTSFDNATLFGRMFRVQFTGETNGADIDWNFTILDADGSGSGLGGSEPATIGAVGQVWLSANTAFGAVSPAMGHVAVYDTSVAGLASSDALDGYTGYIPTDRMFYALADETDLSIRFAGDQTIAADLSNPTMGPQPATALLSILREAEAVDQGILIDIAPPGSAVADLPGLYYIHSGWMLNRTPDLTIDIDAGQLAPPFAPRYEFSDLANDVEVSRPSGASARVIDKNGPVGVGAVGRFRKSASVNVETDTQLPDQAGWRVHLGTAEGMRYPVVRMNFRRAPELLLAWLSCTQVGSIIRLTNLPSGHAPDDLDLLVVGYSMRLGPFEWTVNAVCSPAAPYAVGVLAETSGNTNTRRGWLTFDSCTLDTGVDSDDATFLVNCTPLDSTSATDFPRDMFIDGERVTVTACSGASQPQTWTVTRAVNGFAASHDADAAITLAYPLTLTL